MSCKYCKMFDSGDYVYKDRICKIFKDGPKYIAVYARCRRPSPRDFNWIELKIKIIARKTWDRAWQMKYIVYPHPHWIVAGLQGHRYKIGKNFRKWQKESKLS